MKSIYDKLAEAMQSYKTLQHTISNTIQSNPIEQQIAQEEELRRQKLSQIQNMIQPVQQSENPYAGASKGFGEMIGKFIKGKGK